MEIEHTNEASNSQRLHLYNILYTCNIHYLLITLRYKKGTYHMFSLISLELPKLHVIQ